MKEINVYTDGGSRGNPGPAAIGVHIETLGKKYAEVIGRKTNNEAEYEALIFAMKKTKQLVGKNEARKLKLNCFLDSELVVKQLNHEYKLKEKHIQKYFLEIWNLMLDYGSVTFHHIPREKNRIADALLNQALDEDHGQNRLV
jgi:ribonuclease HI